MTAENAARTIRSDPTMVQAGFQWGLSWVTSSWQWEGQVFLAVNVYQTDRDS